MAERRHWDEESGRLAAVFRNLGLWREGKSASFGHCCSERLGMSERAVEQRIALERRLLVLPELRRAMQAGRVTYEKARLIAWQATDRNVSEWIERTDSRSGYPGAPRTCLRTSTGRRASWWGRT